MTAFIDANLFSALLWIWTGVAAATFILLFFVSAPYGKLNRKGWGLQIDNRVAWMVMEAVSLLGMIFLFLTGKNRGLPYLVFILFWTTHYFYRAVVFPLLKKPGGSPMPVLVMLMAMGFNIGNSFFNGYGLFHLDGGYTLGWFLDIRFIVGAALFLFGISINIHSDHILRRLRTKGEHTYKIPYGGFFRFISCPNYFGEILEWSGWALATWSLGGLSFLLWTIANLAPRAASYHAWYQQTFTDYPRERKALIPFIL